MDEGHPGAAEMDGRLRAVFDDLEQQAAGLAFVERDAELADRARGEYASVDLASRIHASLGRQVGLRLAGGLRLEGTLRAAGLDWCSVSCGRDRAWLVILRAVRAASGCSSRAVPPAARPVSARLGIGSALHRLAEGWGSLVLELGAGDQLRGQVARVGADFAEVRPQGRAETVLVPFSAVSAVRPE